MSYLTALRAWVVLKECFLPYSEYTYARKQFSDVFNSSIVLVVSKGHFLNQPGCNRVAKFPTQVRMMHMNLAQSDGSLPGPKQTLDFSHHHHCH